MGSLIGGVSSAGRRLPDLDGNVFRVARSDGAYIWDTQGKRYIDTAMGFGATVLGHGDPSVILAVNAAIARGPMPAFAHDGEEQAADLLASCLGLLSKVIFVNSGSEAIELACRAARALTGKSKIAKFAAGYDGWYDGVAFGNAGGDDAAMTSNSRPARKDTLLLRFNDMADVDQLLADCDDLAAIIVEPILANAGCILPENNYLAYLAAAARKKGILIIADEVLMGFRLHAGLSCERLGFTPDLAAVGKAIGSGFAVAALAGTPETMNVFASGQALWQGTYNGNPVACAAVSATVKRLKEHDYTAVERRGDDLRHYIKSSFERHGMIATTSGFGQVFTIWPGARAPSSYSEAVGIADVSFSSILHLALRRAGLLSMPATFGRHYLSAAHDAAIIDEMKSTFDDAIRATMKVLRT